MRTFVAIIRGFFGVITLDPSWLKAQLEEVGDRPRA